MNESNNERNTAMSFLAGIGVGALIGAVVALLNAPKSGAETRQDLVKVGEDVKMKASEFVKDASVTGSEVIGIGKELVGTAKDKLIETSDELKIKAEKMAKDVANTSSDLLVKGKAIVDTSKEALHDAIEAGKKTMAECDDCTIKPEKTSI